MQKRFLNKYNELILRNLSSKKAFLNDDIKQALKYRERSNLSSMDGFYKAIEANLGVEKTQKDRYIGYFCSIVPEELLLACSLKPVRLCCEDYTWTNAGEEILPGDICPVIKAICGKFYNNVYDYLELVIVPGTCDPKAKLAELLSPVKEVYFLDPGRDSDYLENVDKWTDRYTKFFQFLRQRFQCHAGKKQLLTACKLTNERTEIFKKIYALRIKFPGAINIFDYYVMIYTSFFMDIEQWNKMAEKVYEQAREKQSLSKKPKVLLSGSPVIFPNFKILDVLDQAGLEVAADIQCTGFGRFYNPVAIDEDTESGIIRALTLKNIAGSICPCLLTLEKLINLIIDTVSQYRLDGVVYYNLRLCQVFETQTTIIRQVLKENKIPFLSVKTDFGKEDTGQLKTRLEAFREIIQSGKE